MEELLEQINDWSQRKPKVALARVIKTWGSSPRPAGSIMLISADGQMAGSVSGGCVEGSVVRSANEVLESSEARKLAYGVTDEDAWSVGLSCGGRIQVFVEPVHFSQMPVWSALRDNLSNNRSSIMITSLEDGHNSNTLIDENGSAVGDDISDALIDMARDAYSQRSHRTVEFEGKEYFIQIFPRKAQLLIIGAAHITVDLVRLGKMYGFEAIVIDPRGFFADNIVFNDPPDRIIKAYPSEVLTDLTLDAYTFCAILSHDPKIDDNALEILLPSEVAYIGALGSRKTHEKRISRLREKGIGDELIQKIHAPVGLDIRAKSAREIALSVMGEIIQVKNQFL